MVHHLSKTTAAVDNEFKMRAATRNIATLTQQHADWLGDYVNTHYKPAERKKIKRNDPFAGNRRP